jgi:hypothetical protein
MGEDAKFPASLHGGYAQCWSWDYDPDDGWVYVVATGFQRDKGIILMRVRPERIGQRSRYVSWGFTDGRWAWGQTATPITPEEAFQEQRSRNFTAAMCCRARGSTFRAASG